MKYLSITLSILFSVLCAGCSDEDMVQNTQGAYTFSFTTRAEGSEDSLDRNMVSSLHAFLAKDGVVSEVYKDLTLTDGKVTIESSAGGDRIYFVANPPIDQVTSGLTEEQLLTLSTRTSIGDGKTPLMTGKADLPVAQKNAVVSLKRAIARIDLEIIAGDAEIQINSIGLKNLLSHAYFFPQEPIASPSGATSQTANLSYEPYTPGKYEGVFHLFEQVGDPIQVRFEGTLNGAAVTLSLELPATIRRNSIYKMKIFNGANATLRASVSVADEEWETGETATSTPSTGLPVNLELSTLANGARLNASKDTLYLPSYESISVLVLDNDVPEDAGFTIDGVGTVAITPLPNSRADIQGNRFEISASRKALGTRKSEYMYLNMHSGEQPDLYTGRLVIVRQPTSLLVGEELLKHLTNEPSSYSIRYDKYVDNALGTIEVPQHHEIAARSEGNWLRLVEKGNRVYEIQAGYKPNDPEADGSTQECTLTVTSPQGMEERFVFSRKNYGLPVVLMGGTYWCRFNLRGNSKRYEDQVQIKDAAGITDDAAYLASCPNEEFVRMLGSQYVGTQTEGFGIRYDATSAKFVPDNNGVPIVPDVEIATGPATAHCPEGYQIPREADLLSITNAEGALLSFAGVPEEYTTGGGKKAVYVNNKRPNVYCDNRRFGDIAYHKITIENENSLVMAGMGHRTDANVISSNWVYWAVITGNSTTWTSSSMSIQSGSPVDSKISRTIRCIKSKPAFVIEE